MKTTLWLAALAVLVGAVTTGAGVMPFAAMTGNEALICHLPSQDRARGRVIAVSERAVAKHLDHEDCRASAGAAAGDSCGCGPACPPNCEF